MKYIILIFLLISGCAYNSSLVKDDYETIYVRKDNYLISYRPEYHNLKDIISKQEYRILPSYLQDCYEKLEIKRE